MFPDGDGALSALRNIFRPIAEEAAERAQTKFFEENEADPISNRGIGDKVPRFKFPGTPINREESPAEEKEPVSDDSSVCDSSVSSKSQSSTSSYSSSSTCHRSSRSKKKRKSKSSPVKQAQERSEEALRPAVSKRKVHQQLPDAVFQAGKERQRFPDLHKLVGYRELHCRKSV
jgi:hypothetical protein